MFSHCCCQLRRKATRIFIGGAAGFLGGAVLGATAAIAAVSYIQQQHAGVPKELV